MYRASRYHCMGGPCTSLITRGDVAGTHIAAMKTPAKCQMMKTVSAIRMTSGGRPPRRSRAGDAGFGFGAGGGIDELGVLIAAPTMSPYSKQFQNRGLAPGG